MLMLSPTVLVVLALASFRLTRLVCVDLLTEQIRARFVAWAYHPRAGRVRARCGDLITCRWCAGWWVTGLVVLAWCHLDGIDVADHAGDLAVAWVAVAGAAGLLQIADPE